MKCHCKILQLMTLYHRIKSNVQKTSFRQTWTVDLNQRNAIFSRHILAHYDVPTTIKLSLVEKVSVFQKRLYISSHASIIWALFWLLTMATQFLGTTLWLLIIHHHTMSGYKRFRASEDIMWANTNWTFKPSLGDIFTFQHIMHYSQASLLARKSLIRKYSRYRQCLVIWAFTVTLTLKIVTLFFGMKLRLMMALQHTKFDYKRLNSSEGIIHTKLRQMDTQTDGHWFKYTNISADLKKWISGCSLRWIVNTLSEYFANTFLFQSSSPVHLSKPAHDHFSFVCLHNLAS